MSAQNEHGFAEPTDKPDQTRILAQGITRFAQYTSPIMLAMLASAGRNAALAATVFE